MCRLVAWLTVYLLLKISSGQVIDPNICPGGLTVAPADSQWPTILPNRFEIVVEISTSVETFEVTQVFVGPYRDAIYFHNFEIDFETHYDYEANEMLIINRDLECERKEIAWNEPAPYFVSQIVKPSVLLGFDGRDNYNNAFFTRYIGKETVRGGILAKKFQSCFHIEQENMTVNATYYISDSPPNQINANDAPDFVQIDVRTNNLAYTYNIIRYELKSTATIITPSGAYCENRTSTKNFPQNLPSRLSIHAEGYTPTTEDAASRIESTNLLVDESIEFERSDYSASTNLTQSLPNRLLTDYSANLSYFYTRDTQQCTVMNASTHSMGTTSQILFQSGNGNDSIQFQYTGLTRCSREHVLCHRWIGQLNSPEILQQFEWYWSAKYNNIDLQEFIPIKLNLLTSYKIGPPKKLTEEISIFNYNPRPNSMQAIDSTLAECYRALGPSHNFNYAILRMTFNNDAKYPVHQHLLSFENRLHMQLANDLKIRHIRLSSFVIDVSRDTTDQRDKDVDVTFTLLDNPPVSTTSLKEPASLNLIRHLARQINDGRFHVRDADGGFDLQARPNSLRTLVLYLLPSEDHINYFNETVFVYHNVTQTVIRRREKIVHTNTGPHIAALWTGFALLGLVVALAVGSFVAIRKWTPAVNYQRT